MASQYPSINDRELDLEKKIANNTALIADNGGGGGGGSGTVTSVSVTTANGVSGSVATATTTPAITLTLGAITPTTIVASGAVSGSNLSGTNTGDQTNITGNAATVTVADAGGDTTTWPLLGTSQTGSLAPATDAGLTYNATSNALTATTFIGALTGNASTATTVTTNANLTGPVTSSGNATTITDAAVTLAKMADLAQDQFIGRTTASTGVPQTATITSAARTVLDDATVGAMVDTIGGASATGTGGLARSTSPRFTTEISPASNDSAALGTTSLGWSDLHLATGALINVANGNSVVTHSSGILTVSTGDLRVTTAGTNTASVATVGGTQTLSGKAITKRVVTTTDDSTAVIDVTLTDVYQLSAVANATTFSTTGTPVDGQHLIIRFKDAGVAKGLTWDAIFVVIGVTLPTTTVVSKWHYVACEYNSAASAFHVLAVSVQA